MPQRRNQSRPVPLRQLVPYLCLAAVLVTASGWVLEHVTGALVLEIPVSDTDDAPPSRVERWASAAEYRPQSAKADADWLGSSEMFKPPIPVASAPPRDYPRVARLEPSQVASDASSIDPDATYRTLCVRHCDGAYFPVSFTTRPQYFEADAAKCTRACGEGASLYVHKNPGEGSYHMRSRDGRNYRDMPWAYQFRIAYDPACACRSGTPIEAVAAAEPPPGGGHVAEMSDGQHQLDTLFSAALAAEHHLPGLPTPRGVPIAAVEPDLVGGVALIDPVDTQAGPATIEPQPKPEVMAAVAPAVVPETLISPVRTSVAEVSRKRQAQTPVRQARVRAVRSDRREYRVSSRSSDSLGYPGEIVRRALMGMY